MNKIFTRIIASVAVVATVLTGGALILNQDAQAASYYANKKKPTSAVVRVPGFSTASAITCGCKKTKVVTAYLGLPGTGCAQYSVTLKTDFEHSKTASGTKTVTDYTHTHTCLITCAPLTENRMDTAATTNVVKQTKNKKTTTKTNTSTAFTQNQTSVSVLGLSRTKYNTNIITKNNLTKKSTKTSNSKNTTCTECQITRVPFSNTALIKTHCCGQQIVFNIKSGKVTLYK